MTAAKQTRSDGNLFSTLVVADLRNITRDALLAVIIVSPLLVAILYRAFVPDAERLAAMLGAYLAAPAAERLSVAVAPLLMSLLTLISPGLIGSVYGLLLVDERDERTLMVLRVMPVAFSRYLLARMATPSVLSVLMTIIAYPLAGLAPLPVWTVITLAVAGATGVPVVTLAMAAFAPNKVAALAIMRVVNTILALPILAYFATPPVLYLAWPVPSYWQMKALWLAADGEPFAGAVATTVAMNVALSLWLYQSFVRRAEA